MVTTNSQVGRDPGDDLAQTPCSKQGQLQEDQDLVQLGFKYLQGLGNFGTNHLG